MRETAGKKNNPQIWDIRDQWSLLSIMYAKRKRVYVQGGFILAFDKPLPEEVNHFKGKCYL